MTRFEGLGATLNGETSEDRTVYYETAASNGLERMLWAEADRMGFLLPALTQEKLDNQREVIKNERRETVDNVPYGQADGGAAGGDLSPGPSLPAQHLRLDGRPVGRQYVRCSVVLSEALRPE